MSLAEIEEASGELHRRTGVALRRIGEIRADRPVLPPLVANLTPRQYATHLATALELGCASLGAVIAGDRPPLARSDRHPAVVAALTYGAPTLPALLARLEQDRRVLTSLARRLEPRFAERCETAWGDLTIGQLAVELAIAEPARVAQMLERVTTTMVRGLSALAD